jgi:hypothetical protein
MPNLRDKVLFLKEAAVTLPSNINPAYESLDPDNPSAAFEVIERQLNAWGVVPGPSSPPPAVVTSLSEKYLDDLLDGISLGAHDATATRLRRLFGTVNKAFADDWYGESPRRRSRVRVIRVDVRGPYRSLAARPSRGQLRRAPVQRIYAGPTEPELPEADEPPDFSEPADYVDSDTEDWYGEVVDLRRYWARPGRWSGWRESSPQAFLPA